MMNYFVMVCEGKHPVAPVKVSPRIPGWMLGREVTTPSFLPLTYELNPNYPGTPKAMYDELGVPLMHQSVRAALVSAGVNNIQYFDALLIDPLSGATFHDYLAFNIIGAVSCADTQRSQMMNTSDSLMTDSDFHSLVIDESRAAGKLLFRLAENISAIIVHLKVKEAIETAAINGFVFFDPEKWSG